MLVKADHPLLQYSGRIDWSDREAPVLVFPCSFVKMKFTGTSVAAAVENHQSYFNGFWDI